MSTSPLNTTSFLFIQGDREEYLPLLWLPTESLLRVDFDESSEVFSAAMGVLQILSFGLHPFIELQDFPIEERVLYVCI